MHKEKEKERESNAKEKNIQKINKIYSNILLSFILLASISLRNPFLLLQP